MITKEFIITYLKNYYKEKKEIPKSENLSY